ncbi:hypothetical protein ACIRL0_05185 [Streptomyces sp. NPDC102365]|uniref:hypothetical protein n=1 Tax=Streptomyces sp. NPDC102365 TaxID=3366162 RepID=UPI0038023870
MRRSRIREGRKGRSGNAGPARAVRAVAAAVLVTAGLGGATASGVFTDDEEVLRTPTSVRL